MPDIDFQPVASGAIDFQPLEQTHAQVGFQPVSPSSSTPETDKSLLQQGIALAKTPSPSWLQGIEQRTKAFVEGAGIPTSLEGLKQFGEFLIRNPIQDVKDIATDVSKIPEKVRNIGQTLSTSPAATVARAPLSPEAFGVYGTTAAMLAPGVFEKLKPEAKPPTKGATDASGITSPASVPQLEVRPQVGEETPLRQQGETPQTREQPRPASESVAAETPPTDKPGITPSKSLFVEFAGEKHPVESIEDASRRFSMASDAAIMEKGTEGVPVQNRIVDANGNPVGRISPNGRVWDTEGNLIYDPRSQPRPASESVAAETPPTDEQVAPVIQPEQLPPELQNPRFRIVGSRGRGEPTPTSDYDVVTKLTPEEYQTWINTPEGEYQRIPDDIKNAAFSGHDVFIETPEGHAFKVEEHPVDGRPNVVVERVSQIEQNLLSGKPKPSAVSEPVSSPAEAERPNLTSTKNAIVDQERVARGLKPIAADAGTAHPETWAKAEKRLNENPLAGKLLVEDIVDRGREEFSTADEALLLREKIATQTARQAASDRVLDPSLSESDRTQARSDYDALEAHSQRIDEAMHKTGSKWSEFGRFRQLLAADDYSLRAMNDRMRIAKGSKPITPQETASIKVLHDKIADLQGKLNAHEAARAFDTEFKKLVEQSRKEAKTAKTKGTRFTEFMDQKANEARQRIVSRRGRLTTGFDPTAITDEAIIGASHIAKGLTKFADWSAQMIREFGDRVRPYLKDIWERAKSLHDANAKEYGDKALARYKTYLGKQTEQIKAKIEAGDFVKAKRHKTKLDAEAFTMRANLQKLKNEFERGVNKEAYKNKTPAQKFWDHFVGVERAMKLSGPSVFGKLGTAAMVREVLSPIEASIGYGASRAFPRLAAGTRYGAGLRTVLRSEIKAKSAFFTKGMKELAQTASGKETELDAIGGKYGTRPKFWYNRIGEMHAAIKAPVKRAAFTRSLETRMESALKAGEDINHPEVMTRLANEAVMDANREIFQENTVVSKMFSMLERQSPVAGRVARFLFPVVKIPVNLFKEFVNLNVGAPVAATRIGMAYWKGVETLPALQREAIIRQLVKGSTGGAALLWGYYNSDKVRSFFDSMPQWFAHTPMAMVLNEGSYLKGLNDPNQAQQSRKELAYMAKTGIPFMYSVTDVTSALDAHNSHALLNWINNMTQSTVVPQISSQIAKTSGTGISWRITASVFLLTV